MKHYAYITIHVLSAIIFAGCHGASDHTHDEINNNEEHAHAGEITFTIQQAEAAELKTETVKSSVFRSVIKTSGEIQTLQGDEHTIVATTSGIIRYENPSITEGSRVTAGSPIVKISAEKMQDGDPVTKARLTYETAEKEYQRAQRLVKDRIISQKEYEKIKMDYETARAAYIGQSSDVTPGGTLVRTPITGYIKNRIAANGTYVSVGEPIAVVTSSRRLQLRADVSERYYSQLGSIISANFSTSYDDRVYSIDSLDGCLLSYGRTASEGSSYIPVTFEFDNKGTIIPGSYAEVYLLGTQRTNIITIPITALTEEQGHYYVYIQEHPEAYVKKEVTLGSSDGTRTEILSGIAEGDKVVIRGAYQVKMASATAEIPGHTH